MRCFLATGVFGERSLGTPLDLKAVLRNSPATGFCAGNFVPNNR